MLNKQEKHFGLIFTGFFCLVAFWPLWPLHPPSVVWLLAAGLSLVLALFMPRLLSPLYRVWMAIGHALGWVNSRIILGFLFFIIVTPTAMIMKILGRDLLNCRLHRKGSYWVTRDANWDAQSMRNQF
jgi:hypothetical protein